MTAPCPKKFITSVRGGMRVGSGSVGLNFQIHIIFYKSRLQMNQPLPRMLPFCPFAFVFPFAPILCSFPLPPPPTLLLLIFVFIPQVFKTLLKILKSSEVSLEIPWEKSNANFK